MIHSEKFADNNDKFEIKTAQDSVPSDLNPCQKKAFLAAARHKVILIAGGAGVGKSYVVGKIAELYVEHEYRVALATATGAATGALRVSLGLVSNFDDVFRFINFLTWFKDKTHAPLPSHERHC